MWSLPLLKWQTYQIYDPNTWKFHIPFMPNCASNWSKQPRQRTLLGCHVLSFHLCPHCHYSYLPSTAMQMIIQVCGHVEKLLNTWMKYSRVYVIPHHLVLSAKSVENFWQGVMALAPHAAPTPPSPPPIPFPQPPLVDLGMRKIQMSHWMNSGALFFIE